ncbi:MAG: hypothetical protein NC116_12325 [Clostridium sp.]|nr:hypothetical protein [Clostridium sp.]
MIVYPIQIHQILMIAYLHNPALVHHHYLVGMAYGAQPVGNHQHRPVLECGRESLYYFFCSFTVSRALVASSRNRYLGFLYNALISV